MEKRSWIFVVGTFMVTCGMCADSGAVRSEGQDEAFEQLINVYYRQPDVEKVIAAIPYVVKTAEKKTSVIMPMSGFYFGAVSKSLDRRDAWEKIRKGLKTRWLAKTIGNALDGKKLFDLVDDDPETIGPGNLDFFWGYFLATGDATAPRMVITRGGMVFPENASFDLTASSAQWSALSMAKDHPIVKAELEKFAEGASEKELGTFFGESISDQARQLLSRRAVMRIERALAKVKQQKKRSEKKKGGGDVQPALSQIFPSDYDAALKKAKADGRKILAVFTGRNLTVWCRKMECEVLSKPEFRDFATNEYELVLLDFTQGGNQQAEKIRLRNADLQKKFNVQDFPAVLVIDANEKIIMRTGYEKGGATSWIVKFRENLRLQPLRERYLKGFVDEYEAMALNLQRTIDCVGELDDSRKVERLKGMLREACSTLKDAVSRLEALAVPGELESERQDLIEALKDEMDRFQSVIDTETEKLVMRPGAETPAKRNERGPVP